MLKVVFTNGFEKDLKRAAKRGLPMDALSNVIDLLTAEEPLPERFCDHQLKGEYAGYRECHIKPDWLLIYDIENGVLTFSRTGSHADLF